LKFTEIKISGLKEGTHSFHFQLDNKFLEGFSNQIFDAPKVDVFVEIHLGETMIKANLELKGKVLLVCDRSGESFWKDIENMTTYYLKYGEKEEEISDEMCTISKERTSIDFDQLVYDIMALSVPLKKLHPRFSEEEEDENSEGILVFSSETDEAKNQEEKAETDPRWQKLKDLITK
jgi:uncharacterized metal-binding protein YceD (DUF177 family)